MLQFLARRAAMLAGLCLCGFAAQVPRVEAGVQATAPDAAAHPQWLRLVHYEPDRSSGSGWRSAVVSPEFFLAKDGATQPGSELAATLAAFALPAGDNPDEHAQCRFRARLLWLDRVLGLDNLGIERRDCPAYSRWSFNGKTESVSVVLATGYLGNPASFYGHILLKFNAAGAVHTAGLLDSSINYGAIVPADVDPVTYIVNGVFGGYEGGFSHIEFYHHTHNYTEVELRDMWEFELALTPDEVALMSAHAWEMIGRKFRYFFFRENCAYRMAELIETIEGVHVMPEARPWTIPQSLVLNIAKSSHHGRPLLANVSYRPSRQSRFYRRYAELDTAARARLAEAVAEPGYLRDPAYGELPVAAKTAVLDALIDFYQFQRDDKPTADDPVEQRYRAALSARFALPAEPGATSPPAPTGPQAGRPPGLARAGVIHSSSLGDGAALELRGAYYDPLDAETGHVGHSALTMGETRLAIHEDRLRLESLDFLRIDSANGQATGLPGDRSRNWRLKLGLESQNLACRSCLVLRFGGGFGPSLRIGNHLLAGATIGGAVQSERRGEGLAFAEVASFANLANLGPLSARAEHRHRVPVDYDLEHRNVYAVEIRARLHPRWESRLRYQQHDAEQLALLLGWYW